MALGYVDTEVGSLEVRRFGYAEDDDEWLYEFSDLRGEDCVQIRLNRDQVLRLSIWLAGNLHPENGGTPVPKNEGSLNQTIQTSTLPKERTEFRTYVSD